VSKRKLTEDMLEEAANRTARGGAGCCFRGAQGASTRGTSMIALAACLLLHASTLASPACHAPHAAWHPADELHQVVPAQHSHAWRT